MTKKISLQDRVAQQISFVWGNTPEGDTGTMVTVAEHLGYSPEDLRMLGTIIEGNTLTLVQKS